MPKLKVYVERCLMLESESLRTIWAIREEMYEEEKRLGREEFCRRQRQTAEEIIKGTRARIVPASAAARRR